jgi:hypothetical protein
LTNIRMRSALVLAFALAASLAVALGPTSVLPSAHATCAGAGVTGQIDQNFGGHVVATEANVGGACNADGVYRGTIADRREDGKCAQVKFRDAGVVSTQGIDCTANNGPVEYVFYDRNGNNNADIKVCIEGTCDDFPWLNIWGY